MQKCDCNHEKIKKNFGNRLIFYLNLVLSLSSFVCITQNGRRQWFSFQKASSRGIFVVYLFGSGWENRTNTSQERKKDQTILSVLNAAKDKKKYIIIIAQFFFLSLFIVRHRSPHDKSASSNHLNQMRREGCVWICIDRWFCISFWIFATVKSKFFF